jgi:hypothetical protein
VVIAALAVSASVDNHHVAKTHLGFLRRSEFHEESKAQCGTQQSWPQALHALAPMNFVPESIKRANNQLGYQTPDHGSSNV